MHRPTSRPSLSDELAFARIQRDTLAQTWPAHKSATVVQRLRELDRRIEDLEQRVNPK